MKEINEENPQMSKGNLFKKHNGLEISDELIQLRSDALFGGKFKFLGRKTGAIRYGYFECIEHGVIFEQSLSTHFRGQVSKKCKACFHNILSKAIRARDYKPKGNIHHMALSDEFITNKIYEVHKGRLKFIRRDENNFLFGIYECPHGKQLRNMITYNLKGRFPRGCITCTRATRKFESRITPDVIRERSFKHFNGKIYFIELDSKNKIKGRFNCREHGIKFTQILYHHFRGQNGCKLCRIGKSRLHKSIYKELLKYFVAEEIVEEKTFDDCKNLYHLKYDLYIEKYNLLIEADGEGHFFNIAQWGGEEGFKTRVHNDQIKNKYTKKNEINFLRISFFEINEMKNILEEYITKIKKGEIVYRIHDNKIPEK